MKSMRFVIQRVTEATCEVDQKITGQITNGFCVLIGIAETDTKNIADKMIRKLLGMRIFGTGGQGVRHPVPPGKERRHRPAHPESVCGVIRRI